MALVLDSHPKKDSDGPVHVGPDFTLWIGRTIWEYFGAALEYNWLAHTSKTVTSAISALSPHGAIR